MPTIKIIQSNLKGSHSPVLLPIIVNEILRNRENVKITVSRMLDEFKSYSPPRYTGVFQLTVREACWRMRCDSISTQNIAISTDSRAGIKTLESAVTNYKVFIFWALGHKDMDENEGENIEGKYSH